MKRGTPHLPKTIALAEALKIPLYGAVGILEMLWQHAAQSTPRGDIGSLPDSSIAKAIDWKRRPAELIEALLATKWLDADEEYRIVVHDWPEHCEQSVIKWLEYNKKDFLPIYRQSLENRKRKSRFSHPSRVAKAEAKADFKDLEKDDPAENQEPLPELVLYAGGGISATVLNPAMQFDEAWMRYVAFFAHGGKAVSIHDLNTAFGRWNRMDFEGKLQATQHAERMCQTASNGQYIKNPKYHLEEKPWTGRALPRTIETVKPGQLSIHEKAKKLAERVSNAKL